MSWLVPFLQIAVVPAIVGILAGLLVSRWTR